MTLKWETHALVVQVSPVAETEGSMDMATTATARGIIEKPINV